jgi:hypothetical protein
MAEIKRIELQCGACKAWFPSPIQIGDTGSFENSTLIGNKFRCGSCGAMSPCNKENMRWTRSDGKGGWVGIDTKG